MQQVLKTKFWYIKQPYWNARHSYAHTYENLHTQIRTDFYTQQKFSISLLVLSHYNLETSLIGKALDFGPRYYRFESCVSKTIYLNSYSDFLNQFLLCAFKKRLYSEMRLTTRSKQLARLFLTLNLLRRVKKVHSGLWRFFPTYGRVRRHSRIVKVYNLTSSKKVLSLRALQILNINCPFSYYVIETNRGIMTHKDALKHKLGGFLICVIL